MYRLTKRKIIIEDKSITEYGIADEKRTFCCFTESKEEAERLSLLLNEHGVEPSHVLDIIEDMFYT